MTDKLMQAWSSSKSPGIKQLRFTQSEIPELSEGFVLVKIHCAALNFSDGLMINDCYQIKPPRPFIPGQEISGTVAKVFPGSRWKVGDKITSKVEWGGFAEFVCIPEYMPLPIPDSLTFSTAVALPIVYTTSMVALTECALTNDNKVILIHAAAGGIGLAAVQIGKAIGATVIATSSKNEKLAIAKEQGADFLVNTSESTWIEQVKAATNDKGVDIIVDPVGGVIGEQSLRCIARDGVLLTVGFASGVIPKYPAHLLLLKRASVKGVYWNHLLDKDMLERVNAKITQMLKNDQLHPLIDSVYQLSQLPDALVKLESGKSVGKVIININDTDANPK